MHNQFLAGMQASTNASMANTNAAMEARSAATSDRKDFALDRRTVMNADSGLNYKIFNQAPVCAPQEQQVHGNQQQI
jgi:hypothetical protein